MFYFLHSVEFYVIMLFVAAAVLALCMRPSSRGRAVTHLLEGILSDAPSGEPAIAVTVGGDGTVRILRKGIAGVYADGMVALAVTQVGFDISIEERIVGGSPASGAVTEALFFLDFMACEWYHVKYTSELTGRFVAFSLHVRPGITLVRPLSQ